MTKIAKLSALLLALALAPACGGSKKTAATPTPTPATSNAPAADPAATPATAAADPAGKLDETQCNAALDHAIELMKADPQMAETADQLAAQKPDLVAECLKTGTQKDYDCLMGAKTVQEIGQCEEPSGE